jgi:hypothetical protein
VAHGRPFRFGECRRSTWVGARKDGGDPAPDLSLGDQEAVALEASHHLALEALVVALRQLVVADGVGEERQGELCRP